MVPIKMLGLLAYLSLAFAIVARARPVPMESLAGYGDKAPSLAESGKKALEHFNHFPPAEEVAWLPASTRQHPDWTHIQPPRPSSDPLSHLAGYASGASGASTSSHHHGQASFGGHSGYPADAEGWHPGHYPFEQGQNGFYFGDAASAYPSYHAAGRIAINPHHLVDPHRYQLADPNFGFHSPSESSSSALLGNRPGMTGHPTPVQRRVSAQEQSRLSEQVLTGGMPLEDHGVFSWDHFERSLSQIGNDQLQNLAISAFSAKRTDWQPPLQVMDGAKPLRTFVYSDPDQTLIAQELLKRHPASYKRITDVSDQFRLIQDPGYKAWTKSLSQLLGRLRHDAPRARRAFLPVGGYLIRVQDAISKQDIRPVFAIPNGMQSLSKIAKDQPKAAFLGLLYSGPSPPENARTSTR